MPLVFPTREAYRYRQCCYSCCCCCWRSSFSRALREVYKEETRCCSCHSLVSLFLNVSHCSFICSSESDSSSSSQSRSSLTWTSISRFSMWVLISFCTARGLLTLLWVGLLIALSRCRWLPCALRLSVLLASDRCTWPDVDDPFADLSPIPLYDMFRFWCCWY